MKTSITHFKKAIEHQFSQLTGALDVLTEHAYRKPSSLLFNATIGQHVRHIIELFLELNKGYESGVVNYEKRKRDHRIETDKVFATQLLEQILNTVDKDNKALLLEAGFDENSNSVTQIDTNYHRELAYNIEHCIHHMALIRIGIHELSSVKVQDEFGIASATIKYRKTCVQ